MNRHIRSLLFLPPLATLALLLLPGSPPDAAPHAAKAPGTANAVTIAAMQATGPVNAGKISQLPPAGQVWRFSGAVEGHEAGLRSGLAAARRGQGRIKEGRRFEIGAFTVLRNLREGESIAVSLPDGRTFHGRVNWSRREDGVPGAHGIAIGFKGNKGGLVAGVDASGVVRGRLLVEGDKIGWTLEPGDAGALWLVERRREDLVCELPRAAAAMRANPLPGDPLSTPFSGTPPVLNSRPGATAVLYIDFDGEPTVTYKDWPCNNPGDPAQPIPVPHSGLNADQMTKVWRRVAEDFIQFNINVTTQRSKYTAAGAGNRMRILVAGTLPVEDPLPDQTPPGDDPNVVDDCAGSAGLAMIGSFDQAGTTFAANVPSWLAVSAYVSPGSTPTIEQLSSIASNISHEFGHTLGLDHDGASGDSDGYYDGHGTKPFDWSPIMGSPYRSFTDARAILQWSKNDYPGGVNNGEDDLWIISGTINGFGYAPDENPGYITANHLTATGTANQVGGEGVVSNRDDLDWWLVNVRFPGTTTIEVAPADTGISLPNLDCGFRVEDVVGNTVAGGFHPEDNLEASATLNLAPGTYYVVAYGTGNKTWTTGGYDDYGSTGRYLVTVNLPPDTQDPAPVILSPSAGPLTSQTLTFNGTATDNDRVSALGIYLRRNADNAWWNGSYWQVGPTVLNRDFNETNGQWSCTSVLPQAGGSSPGSLGAGSYDFIVIAEDPAGHSVERRVTVTVDSAGPTVTVGSPAVTLSANGYAFSGTSLDANGVQGVNCFIRRNSDNLYWNGTGWGVPAAFLVTDHAANTDGASHPWTCTATLPQPGAQLTQGSYTFIAIATDTLGNHTQADSVVLIDDGLPPQVAVTAPPHNSFVSTLGSIGGTATDMSGIQNNSVTFTLYQVSSGKFWSGANWVDSITLLSATVSGTNWSFSAMPQGPFLTAGQYLISSNARDNASTLSQPVSGVNQTSFRVDLDPPTVSITAPLDRAVLSSLPSISGEAQDTNGISAVKLYLYRFSDGKFWDGSAWGGGGSAILPTQVTGNNWTSLPAANLPQPGSNPAYNLTNGSYNLMAFAVDTAGNQTRTDAIVTVELTYTWTGATLRDGDPNNNSNSWSTAANWEPVGVPGSEDKVILANGDRVDSDISRTVLGIQLSSGTLNFTTGDRTLTTIANSTWTGGTFYGVWENAAGAQLAFSGGDTKQLRDGSALNNSGLIVWEGPGPISAEGNGFVENPIINNRSGARIRLTGSGDVFARLSGRSGIPVLNNEAGALLEAVDGTARINTFLFNNAGVIEFTGGAVLTLNTITSMLNAPPLTGTGTLVQEGGPFSIKGDLHLAGPQVLFRGGDISGHADNSATFKVSAGGRIRLYGGHFFNQFTVAAGSRIEIEDAPEGPLPRMFRDGLVLENFGTVNWRGTSPITSEGNGFVANPIFNNRSGSVFNASGGPNIFNRASGRSGAPVFNNEAGAVFQKSAATPPVPVLTVDTVVFNNQGALVCSDGVLAFNTTLNHNSLTPLAGPGTYEHRTGRLGITGRLAVSGTSLLLLGGDNVSEGDSAVLSATGDSRIHLRGGHYFNKFTINAGDRVEIDDPASGPVSRMFRDGFVLDNSGTVTWPGGSVILAEGNGFVANPVFNNKSGGVFLAAADGQLFSRASGRSGVPVFNNEAGGTFRKSGGSGELIFDTFHLNNLGSLVCDAGLVAFNTFVNHNSTTPLTGPGTWEMRSGRLGITGPLAVTGTSLFLLGGEIASEGGSAVLSAAGSARIHLRGGHYFSRFTVNAGDRIEIDDPASGPVSRMFRDGFVLDNSGTVTWAGGSAILSQGDGFDPNPVFNNKSGGVFLAAADGQLFSRASGRAGVPVFNNQAGATFRKSAGSGDLVWDTTHLINNGSLTCISGRLVFNTRLVHESSAPLNGPGSYRMAGGNLELRGPLTVDGTEWVIAAGDLNMHGDGTAMLAAANGGLFRARGGRYFGPWTLGAATRMDFESGDAGDTAKYFADGSVVTILGHMRWLGGGPIQAEGNGFVANPVFQNKPGARFEFAAGGAPFTRASARSGVPVFINEAGAVMENTAATEVALHTFWIEQQGLIRAGTGGFSYNTELRNAGGAVFAGPAAHRFLAGTLRMNGSATSENAVFEIAGGTTTGSAAAGFATTGTGAWKWTGGTFTGRFAVPAGSRFFITDGSSGATVKFITDGSVFDNAGILEWTGAGPIQGEGNGFVENPVINNLAGGSFTDMATGVFNRASYRSGAPLFNNHGNVTVGPGTGDWTMEGWNFTQHSTGLLNLEMAGTGAGQFDRLNVNWTATLGGTLSVTKLNGYAPPQGTTFPFLTAGSVSGSFAIVTGGFTAEYTGTTATLRAGAAALPFNDWAASKGLTGANALPGADPDKDGFDNFYEYVHNLNPTAASAAPATPGTATVGGQQFLTLHYRRYDDREAAGVTYTPQTGTGLGNWGTAGIIEEVDPAAPVIPGSTACRCRVPITGSTLKFLRVKAVKP